MSDSDNSVDALPAKEHFTAVATQQAHDALEQHTLASTAGTKHNQRFALINMHVHMLQHGERIKAFGQVSHLQQRLRVGFCDRHAVERIIPPAMDLPIEL